MEIVVLLVLPAATLKYFEAQRKMKVPRANPGAARHPGRARWGAIPGCPTPGRQQSPARGAGAGAAIGAMHTRSTDAADRLENIGKPKGEQGVPQDSHENRGAFQKWGTRHDTCCPPRREEHTQAHRTPTRERTALTARECTRSCEKVVHITSATLICSICSICSNISNISNICE